MGPEPSKARRSFLTALVGLGSAAIGLVLAVPSPTSAVRKERRALDGSGPMWQPLTRRARAIRLRGVVLFGRAAVFQLTAHGRNDHDFLALARP